MIKRAALLCGPMLAGCAATPDFDAKTYDTTLPPIQAIADAAGVQGRAVMWGGVIVQSSNITTGTQLEILSYPLNRLQRPDQNLPAGNRFLAVKDGYLETMDFAEGRHVTVVGHIKGTQQGTIGEAPYTYPIVALDDIFLWPVAQQSTEPRFTFGIGVSIHK